MKVRRVILPKQWKSRVKKRCTKTVTSTGTYHFDGNKYQCGRFAQFTIDRKYYCTQHAGQEALQHLIKLEQE